MVTEDYVSFETAKLLKEKGFSENTICKYADIGGVTEKWYDDYRERIVSFDWEEGYLIEPLKESKDQYEIIGNTISAPTLQMAMKWLREVHKLSIEPYYGIVVSWVVDIKHIGKCTNSKEFGEVRSKSYNSYEEACESVIKYCLENLI